MATSTSLFFSSSSFLLYLCGKEIGLGFSLDFVFGKKERKIKKEKKKKKKTKDLLAGVGAVALVVICRLR